MTYRTAIAARILGALLGLPLCLNGCSMAQTPRCFSTRHVVLPDHRLAASRLSGGQAGIDLAEAVWRGDADDARRRIVADPRLANVAVEPDPALTSQPDGQYGDLLTFAVARCDAAMVQTLLDAGVPPDGADRGAALSLALLSDDPVLPEALLAHGASPDPQKAGGENVFGTVAAANHAAGAMMLLRHGLDVRWADRFGRTHLDAALSMQVYAIAELLVKTGADLRHPDRDGFTPAHALAKPVLAPMSAADAAARDRLIALAKADGGTWPPPRPTGR